MTGRPLLAARAATSALLASAGLLLVLSERARWWPSCRLGRFDAAACELRQDHRFDQIVPAQPWTPLGGSSLLAGLALVALGLAVMLLLPLLSGRHDRPRWWLPGLLPAAGVVGAGAATLVAHASGHPAAGPLPGLAVYVWALTVPALLLVSGLRAPASDRRDRLTRWLAIACVGASTPLVQFFLARTLVPNRSPDTTPWTWAASGLLLGVAAAAAWVATRRTTSD